MQHRASLGMLLFLLNQAVLFFMLVAAYVYFHASTVPAARNLNLTVAILLTFCLLISSLTMWRAALTGARAWLGATLVTGALFLYGQGSQYLQLFRRNITIARDQFGAAYFTLTGMHALHVLIGLILLAALLRGVARPAALQSIALYWYFVDAVWLLIFAVVYLWTFL